MLIKTLLKASTAMVLVAGVAACATPQPLTDADIASRIAADNAALMVDQEPAAKPISLAEATARALKYNLDQKLKVMETALALQERDLVGWDMLPRLANNAGYVTRSNRGRSTSEAVAAPSTSTDKSYVTNDLSAAWNVLDFGVTYLRSKQQADRTLIAEERKRKVVQNIVQDVRSAWWRALSAQRLLPKLAVLQSETQAALADSRASEKRQLTSPTQALDYQMTLLETLRQVGQLQRDLELAKTELATLMNLRVGSAYALAEPSAALTVPAVAGELAEFQQTALMNRPELREEDYNQRISATETNKALLRLLPGVEMTSDLQYNSNSFLQQNNWVEGGLKVSWNLMNLASASPNYKVNEAREALVATKRQALSMAVVTQVNVAWLRYRMAIADFSLAREMSDVAAKLSKQSETAKNAKAESGLEAIRRSSKAIFVELQRDVAYAELQSAAGRIYVSLGLDPLPETLAASDLPAVTAAVEKMLSDWDSGALVAKREVPAPVTAEQPSAAAPAPTAQAPVVAPAQTSGVEEGKMVVLSLNDRAWIAGK